MNGSHELSQSTVEAGYHTPSKVDFLSLYLPAHTQSWDPVLYLPNTYHIIRLHVHLIILVCLPPPDCQLHEGRDCICLVQPCSPSNQHKA